MSGSTAAWPVVLGVGVTDRHYIIQVQQTLEMYTNAVVETKYKRVLVEIWTLSMDLYLFIILCQTGQRRQIA